MVTLNDYFKTSLGVYSIVKHSIENQNNLMLIGPTGLGKTELVDNIAKTMGLPLTIFDMGTMTDPIMGLVGSHTITVKDGVTHSKFVKSRFSEVIQKPGIVLLDELSRANALSNNLLFPVLDYRRELSMEYSFEDTTPIKVHPECVFIATANIGSQYTGTHKMDRALMDRFMLIEVDSLKKEELTEIVQSLYPTIDEASITKIINVYEGINKLHDDYSISFNLSIRHLKNVCNLVKDGFTIYDSYFSICKGLGGIDGLKTIETVLKA
jgi:nitric oxide reductase NorQ protein